MPVADPGIDGRGAPEEGLGGLPPRYGGLGAAPPAVVQGAERSEGLRPQKLKPRPSLRPLWMPLGKRLVI